VLAGSLSLTLALSPPHALAKEGNSNGGNGNAGRNGNGNAGGDGANGNAGGSKDKSTKKAGEDAAPAPPSEQDQALEAVRSGEAQPLAKLLPRIERRYRSRVIDASLRRAKGVLVYDLKMLSDAGRIFRVSVNAVTGNP
jgi:hypothetical protein